MARATVINDIRHLDVEATLSDRWLMAPHAFAELTGWELKPEGMCNADVCAPIVGRDRVIANGLVDLEQAAPVIGLSAVVDTRRGVAALAVAADTRAAEMRTLRAPDFTLPDLDGRPVSLHDFNRRKVLLLAWSSW